MFKRGQLWILSLCLFATLTVMVIGISYWSYSISFEDRARFLEEVVES